MISYLQGRAVPHDDATATVVTPAGVGYLVRTPRPLRADEDVQLLVHTVVRDNDISLFAFDDDAALRTFRQLLTVPNVGPSMALAVLRDVGVTAVADAVADGRPDLLTPAAGVGGKAAGQIVNSLSPSDLPAPVGADEVAAEAADVLYGLGVDRDQAHRAASETVRALRDAAPADLTVTADDVVVRVLRDQAV